MAARIVCLSSYFASHGGGLELVAERLAIALARRRADWDVTLVAHGTEADAPKVGELATHAIAASNIMDRLFGVPLILPRPVALARALARIVRADVTVVHDNVYLANLLAIVARKVAGRPTILVKHTGEIGFETAMGRIAWRLLRTVLVTPSARLCDDVVFVTDAKRRNLPITEKQGRRVHTIENGVDTDLFHPAPEGASHDNREIVFVGRFVPKKGLDLVRELARRMPDRRFLLLGFGPIRPEDWKLPNVFVERRPERARIAEALAHADAAILPTVGEGVPLVVLEALACGTPTLVSQHCVTHDEALAAVLNVVAYDADELERTSSRWETALRDLLDAPPTHAHAVARRSVVVDRYSEEVCVQAYEALIEASLPTR